MFKHLNNLRSFAAGSLQQLDSFLGGFKYADSNSATSTTTLIWKAHCAADFRSFIASPSLASFLKTGITCLGLDDTSASLYEMFKTKISSSAKKSLKDVSSIFFTLCPPLSFGMPNLNPTASFGYPELISITSLSTSIYAASLLSKNPLIQNMRDPSLLGTAVGTTLSWIFDQNPYVGALSGALSGAFLGFTRSQLPSVPDLGISKAFNQIKNGLAPLLEQRFDLILPGVTSLIGCSAFSSFDPYASKETTLFVGALIFGAAYTSYNSIIPIFKKANEISYWGYENMPTILSLSWMSMTLSLAPESIHSILTETCPNKND